MSKIIFSISLSLLIAGSLLSGCNSSSGDKQRDVTMGSSDNMSKDVTAGQVSDSNDNKWDEQARADIRKFRQDIEDQVTATNRQILETREKIKEEGKSNKKEMEAKLDKIEKRNNELKKDLKDFREDTRDNAERFRKRVNDDFAKVKTDLKQFWNDSFKK